MNNGTGNISEKPRIRLHRTRVNPQIIQKNIENMVPYIETKHFAQAKYYEGKSPLTRAVGSEFPKPPVHERLGVKRRPVPVGIGTQTNMLMPKNRFQRVQQQQNNVRNFRNQKFNRMYSAQTRLRRIRNNMNVNFRPQQNNRHNPQKVRLYRNTPLNYQVQVPNNVVASNPKHSISRHLHPGLQQEIQVIQHQAVSRVKHDFDDTPMLVHATGVPTHERFTNVCG